MTRSGAIPTSSNSSTNLHRRRRREVAGRQRCCARWLEGNDQLGAEARRLLESADEVFFSAATVWELGIKRALGKLDFPDGLADELVAGGFMELPISAAHGDGAARLPPHHHDPFDRLLIAQARIEALVLMTADRAMATYDVDSFDARA